MVSTLANHHEDYGGLISDLIKKQMVMLGPNLVLSRARKIEGLKVLDDGTVAEIKGSPQKAFSELSDSFAELSGHLTHEAIARIMEKYPHLKSGQ